MKIAKLFSDWRWFPFFFQRQFLRKSHRRLGTRFVASFRPRSEGDLPAGSLETVGQDLLGSVLSPEACREVRGFLEQRRVFDEYRAETPPWFPLGEGRHPHSHVGYHDNADTVRSPHLLALANRADILDRVEAFLGCKPTISYLASWWSYPTGIAAQQAENFHRDIDDWRFVKLFVYLTDVDETKGPHVYIKYSGNAEHGGPIRRYTDEEISARYGDDNKVFMLGKAGDGFLEDTYGFHKGQPVLEGHRLMFQAVYSIMPLPYGPKKPVIAMDEAQRIAGMQLDPFINQVYVAR